MTSVWFCSVCSAGVCLTENESHYRTDAINHNTDGSTDYGIFQINSRWWCDNGKHTANGCKIKCSGQLQTTSKILTTHSHLTYNANVVSSSVLDFRNLSSVVANLVNASGC